MEPQIEDPRVADLSRLGLVVFAKELRRLANLVEREIKRADLFPGLSALTAMQPIAATMAEALLKYAVGRLKLNEDEVVELKDSRVMTGVNPVGYL